MKKFLMALAISLSFIVNVEAAELYDVIHQEVSYFNRSQKESEWIARAILYASSEYQVDPILITAVMEAESGFDFQSLSSVGAIGVNPYNPLENILGGTMYLRCQLDRFANYGKYAVTDAVAAYNAGAQAVINAGGVPNYSETRQYVVNVANNYQKILEMINEAER